MRKGYTDLFERWSWAHQRRHGSLGQLTPTPSMANPSLIGAKIIVVTPAEEAWREHANQDIVASGSSHVAFAAMTLWADHVAEELLAKTKRARTQNARDVFFCQASRDSNKDHRERETWEACTVVGASVVVAAATEYGPAEESSAWKAFFPSLSSSSARQVIVSLPRHRCCCIS